MVNKLTVPNSLINYIHQWISRQPRDIMTVLEQETPYEFIVNIRPFNQQASTMEFRISKTTGKFVVSLGRGIQFDDIPPSESSFAEICTAVLDGNVSELLWEYNGRVVKSRGVLELKTDHWHSNRTKLLLGGLGYFLRRIVKRKVRYEPYR